MYPLADHIISIQIDAEEARDFYSEGEYSKMKANLEHLRETCIKALELTPPMDNTESGT